MCENNKVFGVFINDKLHVNRHFYGTGETFLFYLDTNDRVHHFEGTGKNDNYIFSDETMLAFGCSDSKFSLCIEKNFLKGNTTETSTFMNRKLADKENFYVSKLEIWVFDE